MSSSSNNLNPFPCFTSSTSPQISLSLPLPQLHSHEPESFFIHQNYLYPFSLCHFMPPNDATMEKPDVNISSEKRAKKDRHRKIYTAQGLRDRRVRLSVEISRKFFDLQDMLGYDRASKTLEWLLSKSRKAIKELVRAENNYSEAENSGQSLENFASKKRTDPSIPEEKNMGSMSRVGFTDLLVLAKESRAKARARARNRTMEKMIISTEAQSAAFIRTDRENMAEISAIIKSKMKLPMISGSKFLEEAAINDNIFSNFSLNREINIPFERHSLSTNNNSTLSTELKIHGNSSEVYNNQSLLRF